MLRTNSKKYLQNIETYILNQIDGADYGTPTETPAQKIKFLLERVLLILRTILKRPRHTAKTLTT